MNKAALAAMALMLNACDLFPRHGTGGFAEHRATVEPPLYWGSRFVHSDLHMKYFREPGKRHLLAGWLDVHLRQIGCTDFALAGVLQYGARDYFPGMVWQIERQRVKVLRLTAAGLEHDAVTAQNQYRQSVDTLKRSMREQAGQHSGEAACPVF